MGRQSEDTLGWRPWGSEQCSSTWSGDCLSGVSKQTSKEEVEIMTKAGGLFSPDPTYQLAQGAATLPTAEWEKFLATIQSTGATSILPHGKAHKGWRSSIVRLSPSRRPHPPPVVLEDFCFSLLFNFKNYF